MTTSSRPFVGHTALVTGSGQNIGRAVALAFARGGANVIINGSRNQDAIDRVAAEAASFGVKSLPVLADVSKPEDVTNLVERAVAACGSVDIVVSNVAVRRHTSLLDISDSEWRQVIDTNLSASFYLARATLPLMKARGWGRVIHMSGIDGFDAYPDRAHNVACKAAVFALSKAIAVEFGPFGITANTIAPGVIDTVRDLSQYPQFRDGYDKVASDIPVRRVGSVNDIADACIYLAQAGFVTGQVLHVNGGHALF